MRRRFSWPYINLSMPIALLPIHEGKVFPHPCAHKVRRLMLPANPPTLCLRRRNEGAVSLSSSLPSPTTPSSPSFTLYTCIFYVRLYTNLLCAKGIILGWISQRARTQLPRLTDIYYYNWARASSVCSRFRAKWRTEIVTKSSVRMSTIWRKLHKSQLEIWPRNCKAKIPLWLIVCFWRLRVFQAFLALISGVASGLRVYYPISFNCRTAFPVRHRGSKKRFSHAAWQVAFRHCCYVCLRQSRCVHAFYFPQSSDAQHLPPPSPRV
jgi:hypothetical protein